MSSKNHTDSATTARETDTRSQREIDAEIARYRDQVSREADIGRSTLDEIEDHMRLLVADLRSSGMSTAVALSEAAKRLGDPRELAREHARVRTPFGAKLPTWRALAVIALVMPTILWGLTTDDWIEAALGIALCGALVWRSAWSRAALFGGMAWSVVWVIASVAIAGPNVAPDTWIIALNLGALAMLAPWRRADLTATGWGLALLYPLFCAAALILRIQVTGSGPLTEPDAHVAMACTILAGAGLVLRASWAAIAAFTAVLVLVGWLPVQIEAAQFMSHHYGQLAALGAVLICAGLAAGTAIALLSLRTARSGLGEIRGVAS